MAFILRHGNALLRLSRIQSAWLRPASKIGASSQSKAQAKVPLLNRLNWLLVVWLAASALFWEEGSTRRTHVGAFEAINTGSGECPGGLSTARTANLRASSTIG
jgi:hypothetical protein